LSYFHLGYAHYQRGFSSGNPETADAQDASSAVSAYQTALAIDPGLASLDHPSRLYESLGLCYEALDLPEKAAAAYKQAIAVAPGNPLPSLYAARLRCARHELGPCEKNFDLAVKKAAENGRREKLLDLARGFRLFKPLFNSPVVAAELSSDHASPMQASIMAPGLADLRDAMSSLWTPPRREPGLKGIPPLELQAP
jgi:tetratricopeptide (TPR) repeat protein